MAYNNDYIKGLIVEKIAGIISENDNALLERAIEEDTETRIMWKEMQQSLTSATAAAFFDNLDHDHAWDKVKEEISAHKPRNRKFIVITRWLSVAALLFVVVSVAYYLKNKPASDNNLVNVKKSKSAVELLLANGQHINLSDTSKRVINIPSAQIKKGAKGLSYDLTGDKSKAEEWSTLTVPPKLDYQIVLSDGTKVWLNAASTLHFPFLFGGATREVYLTGEGYFEVAKNRARPFIVHTSQTDVKVLGTQFNINAYDVNTTTTSLVEGSVNTTGHNKQQLILKPGLQAIYTPGAGYTTKEFDANIELAWMHGTYYFHNTKLGDISLVISRWYDLKVVFDNPTEAEESFSGAIEKNKPIGVFLKNIKTSADVDAVITAGVLHVK